MHKIFKLTLLLFVLVGLMQCSVHSTSPTSGLPRELTTAENNLINSNNKFGLKLFREVIEQENEDTNVFISPLSVAMALCMTYNGANGTTEEAMRTTLEFGNLTIQEINESYQSLIELLINLDPKVIFQIANSIWYRQGYTFEQEFIDLNKTYFNAEVRDLDFNNPNAADTMNAWVDENTNGKITEIVSKPINPLTVMFLINAIYFKGTWTYEFDPEQTQDDWFTLLGGIQIPCRMMTMGDELYYFQNDDFEAIDLPYGDGKFSMTIFLPKPQTDIDSLIARFNQENWDDWMSSFVKKFGVIELPKFTLEYEKCLNDVLKSLGMEIAFNPSADFTKMRKSGGLWISKVKHKTFVEVNEEGTEAAAVTSVGMDIGSGSGPHIDFYMGVDRPFIFVIREHNSQTILFMGKIVEPSWDGE